ncbi:hypothetical protein Rsub_08784 [Raphidocelis subcapitata]|uniref:Uncharacterized protein n=1 Tax=Raphidocelis subcapitata TaxID=307507 RepID=A0A2V0P9J0_9CHLO|nr:hypothetical protein Rsub_08784 [Raphidocelis subcapitata]|eukprot:GBF96239.1 hypothetical protein Rsub_08784 [Raphidocelis subcapitata]
MACSLKPRAGLAQAASSSRLPAVARPALGTSSIPCARPQHVSRAASSSSCSMRIVSARVSTANNGAPAAAGDAAALPVVKIDNRSDPFATIVTVEFGDRLGELLDTAFPSAAGRGAERAPPPPPPPRAKAVRRAVRRGPRSLELASHRGGANGQRLFVTYHGEPLSGPMTQLVTNALQYYLSLAEVAREESY